MTGSLHLGHAFEQSLIDALIRYHRMCGDNTLFLPGTDHASIAVQTILEKQLKAEGKTRYDVGREKFLERAWEWKAESGGTIVNQLKRMGVSADWTRERFTLDEGLSCGGIRGIRAAASRWVNLSGTVFSQLVSSFAVCGVRFGS